MSSGVGARGGIKDADSVRSVGLPFFFEDEGARGTDASQICTGGSMVYGTMYHIFMGSGTAIILQYSSMLCMFRFVHLDGSLNVRRRRLMGPEGGASGAWRGRGTARAVRGTRAADLQRLCDSPQSAHG